MAKILCNYFGLSMAAEGKSDFVGRKAAAFLGYVQQDAERCAANCGSAEDLSAAPEEIKREILSNDEELRRREQTAPGVEHDVVAIYDNAGIPSIMHRFRRVTNKELFGGSDAVHPAFIIGGEVYDEIYISVYENTMINGKPYSLPLQEPVTNITMEDTKHIAALGADDRKPVKLHVTAEGVRVAGVGQFCPVALHIAALRGKLFLCLTVRQTEKRVSGHSVRPPVLCCVLCGRFCVPMSARPVWGRLGLHQRRRVPSALRVAWVRTWKFAHILRRAVPGRELRRPAAPPCGPCVRRPAFCYRRRSPPGSWPWGRRPARRA